MKARARVTWVDWIGGWVVSCNACTAGYVFLGRRRERRIDSLSLACDKAVRHIRLRHTDLPIEETR